MSQISRFSDRRRRIMLATDCQDQNGSLCWVLCPVPQIPHARKYSSPKRLPGVKDNTTDHLPRSPFHLFGKSFLHRTVEGIFVKSTKNDRLHAKDNMVDPLPTSPSVQNVEYDSGTSAASSYRSKHRMICLSHCQWYQWSILH